MSNQHDASEKAADLRRQAEERIRNQAAEYPGEMANKSPEELKALLHELRVHQIELEMQNEELRRAQIELDAARARYFDLYNLAPMGYCTVSEKGFILEANLTASEMLGIERSAMIKQPLSAFIHPDDQDIYYLHRKKLFETGKPQRCELRLLNADGAILWGEFLATLSEMPDGQPVCRVAMSDITVRKHAEDENTKLQAQLHEAKKMEAVGRLAGGVAHDFNNMLGIILGNIELMLVQEDGDQPITDDLQEIKTAAERSVDLTRQLLSFARKQAVTPKIVDVYETIKSMVIMLQRLVGEHIVFEWGTDNTLWPIKMDPSQMEHILVNLCLNARDAIKGQGKITISTKNVVFDEACCAEHPERVPGAYVQIAVRDTGVGMDRETMDHIFDPFFTTKGVGEGTGMGLATVYGMIKQNSGFITVQSAPGEGTVFDIFLPRYQSVSVNTEPEALEAPTISPGGVTLLLVEDELAVLRLTRRMLENQGHTVLAAVTPGEALQIASYHRDEIRLLITDVVMPEMNGRDLSKKIQALCPKIKTLFMSGYTAAIMAQHGMTENGVNFIQKPFTITELSEKVKEALEN